MKKVAFTLLSSLSLLGLVAGCAGDTSTADQQQQQHQEQTDSQSNSEVGFPAITHFTEKKDLKMIYELRDNPKYVTYMYTKNEMDGKWVYQGTAIGYPIPYSTEFTNPQYIAKYATNVGVAVLPQADPNGLFSSQNTKADWIMRDGPNGLYAEYIEPDTDVTPVKKPAYLCESYSVGPGSGY